MTTLGSSMGPVVTASGIRFFLPDPGRRHAAVGLQQELRRPRTWTAMHHDGNQWQVEFPRYDVARMEYQFKTVASDGGEQTLCDPNNPLRVPGAFGDKSVLEFPEYRSPAWLDGDATLGGQLLSTEIPSRGLHGTVDVDVWTSHNGGFEESLPLLVAHDGREYASYSALLHLLDRATASGQLPAMRAVLLHPRDRDEIYSASAGYARALAGEILPALNWLAPVPTGRNLRVGMGASLGALAMLHAQRLHPGTFGGLFLQSGSFFRQRFDRQESGFPSFQRISRFVGEVLHMPDFVQPVPVTLTCGTVEENLANNAAVTAALVRQGYDAALHVNRDAHNYVAWRDTFDPHLLDLLTKVWG